MAKIILTTQTGYGNWFVLRLLEEGHDVDIYYHNNDKRYSKALAGITPEPLFQKPNFEKYDLSLFDLTGQPRLAEESLKATPTIGDGNFNSQVEDDRLFGIEVMEQCDINVPNYEQFSDLSEAKRYIRKQNKRFVFKPFGGQRQDTATTYVSTSAEDLLRYLDNLERQSHGSEFILQEVVEGTEVSTEAWFNGEDFYLINATLEEKKFMDGNKGPNTGCSGNLVWVYDDVNPPNIFKEGLAKMKDYLQEYKYRGMIDLNTIVSDREVYGLEWTPRFGYDASATLFNLIRSNLGDFIGACASGSRPFYDLRNYFGAGVRISIPPYPSEIKGKHPEDIPIDGIEPDECTEDCFLYDCYLNERDELVTAGLSGFICCPIKSGQNIGETFQKVYAKIDEIHIPNMQYRTDICQRTYDRYKILALQGWLK